MSKQPFDDTRLIDLAFQQYKLGMNPVYPPVTPIASGKTGLTNEQRNKILEYMGKSTLQSRPISIKSMKAEIFSIIGATPSPDNPYASTISRADLLAIYNWIKGIKAMQIDVVSKPSDYDGSGRS